jgi:hypothetical protein
MGSGADTVVGIGRAGPVLEVTAKKLIHVALIDLIAVAFVKGVECFEFFGVELLSFGLERHELVFVEFGGDDLESFFWELLFELSDQCEQYSGAVVGAEDGECLS